MPCCLPMDMEDATQFEMWKGWSVIQASVRRLLTCVSINILSDALDMSHKSRLWSGLVWKSMSDMPGWDWWPKSSRFTHTLMQHLFTRSFADENRVKNTCTWNNIHETKTGHQKSLSDMPADLQQIATSAISVKLLSKFVATKTGAEWNSWKRSVSYIVIYNVSYKCLFLTDESQACFRTADLHWRPQSTA